MYKLSFFILPTLLLSSCVIQPGAIPQTGLGFELLSSETHRGMVQSEEPVLQAYSFIRLPAKEEGAIIVASEGSIELSDDTGDAWRPNGQSGRFAAYELSLLYEQRLDQVLLNFGLVSYNLPTGREFRFGPRGSTTELLLEVVAKLWGLHSNLQLNYDVDEVDGLYMKVGAGKDFDLGNKLSLEVNLDLGWMDEDQSFWNFAQAPATSGLADLRLTSRLAYPVDDHTTVSFGVGASEIVDSEFKDWFDVIGVDSSQVWASLGVDWSY